MLCFLLSHTEWINELVLAEYLGSSADPIRIRDGYREMMGDMIFTIPALTLAKAHKGAKCIFCISTCLSLYVNIVHYRFYSSS